jgi:hypothetical protein
LKETIVYREMNPGEERAVCDLVSKVFNEFVSPDYEQEGIEEFFRFANPDAMEERMQSGGFVLVAYQADDLVGMLEFFPPDMIAMLFVTIQHQGVAKELLAQAINKVRVLNPESPKLTVHSSRYAEPIYKKMGFYKTGNTTTENGITYVPMELLLKDKNA